ncbi:MAG: hypothetical protein AVO34_09725 [Firmicutes bacterium ML8_F2]|jgi:hypothetical protein|nr:MAG: hypothetical protein AVO34_09725 [Firmicutes bacterium ML8_F2]
MMKIKDMLFVAIAVILLFITIGGCDHEEATLTEQTILSEEGVFVRQADSQSVEIEIDSEPRTFILGTGVSVTGIADGAEVSFTYVEEERPVLLSIEVKGAVREDEGIYTGQIDSHSVEIEIDGQFMALELAENLEVDEIDDGSRVAFSYRESDTGPVLFSITVLEEPVDSENGEPDGEDTVELVGEGILSGQIDAHSVEIEIVRPFILGEGVDVTGIEDGSLVAFTFTESGQRAVLDSIEAVEQPVEGEVMHGTLIGQIDSQSVEVRYFRAFALDQGISIEEIADGSEVVFTYVEGSQQPVLTSISQR